MENLLPLFSYMRGYKKTYLIAAILMGLSVGFSLVNPLILQIAVDNSIGDLNVENPIVAGIMELLKIESLSGYLWFFAMLYVIFTALRGFLLYFVGKLSASASEGTIKNLRDRLFNHIQRLPFSYHKNANTGDLIQRATSDMETLKKFLALQLVETGKVALMVLFSVYVMWRLSPRMTISAISLTPVIFLFAWFFFRKIQSGFEISDEAEAELSTVIQENLSGIRVVKAFGAEGAQIKVFEEKNSEYRDKSYKLLSDLAWYWSISDFLCFSQIGLVLVYGVYLNLSGEITLGVLVAFTSYVTMLVWPIRQMGNIIADFGKALVSVERIQMILLEEEEDYVETGMKPQIAGNVKFEDVAFSYSDDPKRKILDGINFDIKHGEVLAVLGKTGSGKSTLAHLLAGFYQPVKGKILIDGIDLRSIEKTWLRKSVRLVLQEPFLFSGTITENIDIYGKSEQEQIFKAAKTASIDKDIRRFEKGYETYVGEEGVTLSGGQRQRIAIARTIIDKASVLIFDDSLSALDAKTERQVRKELRAENEEASTLIITHKISTAMEADKIIVIDGGRIVQQGKHDELAVSDGLYKEIWDHQNTFNGNIMTGHRGD